MTNLISRRDLAARWGIDGRHQIFLKLKPAAVAKVGGKNREMFDAGLNRSECLDYLRCKRITSPMKQLSLIGFLEADYGKGWFEETAKNFSL